MLSPAPRVYSGTTSHFRFTPQTDLGISPTFKAINTPFNSRIAVSDAIKKAFFATAKSFFGALRFSLWWGSFRWSRGKPCPLLSRPFPWLRKASLQQRKLSPGIETFLYRKETLLCGSENLRRDKEG